MNTRAEAEVQAYLDRLRTELAGLPDTEIDEILQDVEPQLAAVAAELGEESLADRYGDPAEYARELRSAMGVPDGPGRPPLWQARVGLAVLVVTTLSTTVAGVAISRTYSDDPRYTTLISVFALFACWLAVARQRSAMTEIAALPEVRLLARADPRVTAYLASLRPGWLLVKAAFAWLGGVWLFAWLGWSGSGAATVAIVFAVVTALVGNRAHEDRWWLWLSIPLGGWAVGVAIKAATVLPALTGGTYQ